MHSGLSCRTDNDLLELHSALKGRKILAQGERSEPWVKMMEKSCATGKITKDCKFSGTRMQKIFNELCLRVAESKNSIIFRLRAVYGW
jgi:hypothetical protein